MQSELRVWDVIQRQPSASQSLAAVDAAVWKLRWRPVPPRLNFAPFLLGRMLSGSRLVRKTAVLAVRWAAIVKVTIVKATSLKAALDQSCQVA